MKKLYTLLLAFTCLFSQFAFSQVVVFSFSSSDGSADSWPSSSEATGVGQATMSRGPGIDAVEQSGAFNSISWSTGTVPDLNDYLSFTITPDPGYSITLSSINISHERTSSGPKSFVIRTSQDGFAADATNVVTLSSPNSTVTSTFTFAPAITVSAPLEIRLYGYEATKASGIWGLGGGTSGDLTVSGLTVLPVNFFGLKAVRRNNTVEINWSNATEENVDYYSVEKSTDGQHFSELTRQSSQKNNGGAASYAVTDMHPASGANFYRIRAVELNGQERLSSVLRVDGNQRSAGVNLYLYPNPVRSGSQFTVQLNAVSNGGYKLVLYNTAGATVKQLNMNVSGNSFSQTVETSGLPKGSYLLQISGKEVISQRLVID